LAPFLPFGSEAGGWPPGVGFAWAAACDFGGAV